MASGAYSRYVFINCPFDDAYKPLFDAMLFTLSDCGFHPRSARDRVDSSEVRIAKIYDTIADCRLAIHDLSRTDLANSSNLPRFNMPLEFGIFLGAKRFGNATQKTKSCLVFDTAPYRYQAYVSDIAGQDIATHNDDPQLLVRVLRDWLTSVTKRSLASGAFIWTRYQTFKAELPSACGKLRHDATALTYHEYLGHVDRFRVLRKEQLHLANGAPIDDPAPRAIANALSTLDPKDNTFAVYVRGGSGNTYMQTACDDENEFVLEYQEGSVEQHYQCANRYLKLGGVIDIFQRYARGDDSWKNENEWELINV